MRIRYNNILKKKNFRSNHFEMTISFTNKNSRSSKRRRAKNFIKKKKKRKKKYVQYFPTIVSVASCDESRDVANKTKGEP